MKRPQKVVLENHSTIMKVALTIKEQYTKSRITNLLKEREVEFNDCCLNHLSVVLKKARDSDLQAVVQQQLNINELYRKIKKNDSGMIQYSFIFNEYLSLIKILVQEVTKKITYEKDTGKPAITDTNKLKPLIGYIDLFLKLYEGKSIDLDTYSDIINKTNNIFKMQERDIMLQSYLEYEHQILGKDHPHFFIYKNKIYMR